MKVIVFGATGMVGGGVLRECLLDPGVSHVLTVGRRATGQTHEKLTEIVHGDLTDYGAIEEELTGYDACFYCLGISSVGMSEPDYTRITHDYTMAAAAVLARRNPAMSFLFVSGRGTDSTEKGRSMWGRVKGMTENAVMRLPFASSTMFRPAIIQPKHGITSRTTSYRIFYALMSPFYPLWRALLPSLVTTTEQVGLAMLHVARNGSEKRILENGDINATGAPRAATLTA